MPALLQDPVRAVRRGRPRCRSWRRCRHCDSCQMAPSWHHRGTIVAPSWHHRGTIVAPSWHHRGTIVAPSWHHRGTIVAPSWHHRGTIVAPSWHHRGTVAAPSACHCPTKPASGHRQPDRESEGFRGRRPAGVHAGHRRGVCLAAAGGVGGAIRPGRAQPALRQEMTRASGRASAGGSGLGVGCVGLAVQGRLRLFRQPRVCIALGEQLQDGPGFRRLQVAEVAEGPICNEATARSA